MEKGTNTRERGRERREMGMEVERLVCKTPLIVITFARIN